MHANFESLIKVVLLLFVVLAGLAVLLARRPWIAGRVRFSDRVFAGTFVVAASSGALGITAMFLWPETMSRLHLWEMLLIPVFLAYAYWLPLPRAPGPGPVHEEKELDTGPGGRLGVWRQHDRHARVVETSRRQSDSGLESLPAVPFHRAMHVLARRPLPRAALGRWRYNAGITPRIPGVPAMRRPFALVAAYIVLISTVAFAQTPPVQTRPGMAPPPASQTPQRDKPGAVPGAKTGTAGIKGRILADTNTAIRRARVSLLTSNPLDSHMTTTDLDGRYEFTELPAGQYRVTASKGIFVPLEYGQQKPFDRGKPVDLADGQVVEKIDITLPRGGVV